MDTLVTLSTGIAFIYSTVVTLAGRWLSEKRFHGHVYFEASAVIITFILFGRFLEKKPRVKNLFSIEETYRAQVRSAILVNDSGEQKEVPVSSVMPGDILLVRPGNKYLSMVQFFQEAHL